MARRFLTAACLGSFLLVFLPSGHAQPAALIAPRIGPLIPAPDTPLVSVDSSLILVPTHVTSLDGGTVMNLHKEDFRLWEDNIPQTVAHFAIDDAPVSVGILFDASGSMRNKMETAVRAVSAFFQTANLQDEFFLVRFSDRAHLAVPFTSNPDRISGEIAGTRPFGQTSLLDAIHLAIGQMKNAHHARKALVIFSDGGDNWSRHNAAQVKSALLEADVQVYSMGIFDEATKTAEERRGPKLLSDLAILSGGDHFPVDELDELPSIATRIGRELRDQYVLGYYSTNPSRDGKYRRIKVSLDSPATPSLHTYYRPGYYAPEE